MSAPQSPFSGSCFAHIASLSSAFASSLEGLADKKSNELNWASYLHNLLGSHIQAMQPVVAAVEAAVPAVEAVLPEVEAVVEAVEAL